MTVRWDHLVGRSFLWGVRDCYSMVRDFYADNFGMALTDYARPINWTADQLDLIRFGYEREGFELQPKIKTKDLRPGDLLCVAIGSVKPNHFAIYVGDNTLLHHLYGRASTSETLRDFWINQTCFFLRHPDVPDTRPVLTDTTIEELLRARHQLPAA